MDINEIKYLTFEGGGRKGIVYLGAVKSVMLFLALFTLSFCSAQEQQQDTLPKELEFINVCFPENIKTITYKELNDNLMKQGAKRYEPYPYSDYKIEYTKVLENGFKIELELSTDSAKNTILNLSLKINKNIYYEKNSLL